MLPDFSLDIPAGQTVALVGTTGAGKSTLAKLDLAVLRPHPGPVTLDGVDLRQLHPKDLRRAIVMVTQEAYLFSGTVADNIALGKPEASMDEIRAAARAVGADGFIEALPDGYSTDVNKRGGRVSAGQRQLISFARAFLADPAVLILDEATASLDIPSERLIQDALQTLLADRTAIIIAHRLSTVSIADRVLVMEHGRIIEDDTPRRADRRLRQVRAAARRLAGVARLDVPGHEIGLSSGVVMGEDLRGLVEISDVSTDRRSSMSHANARLTVRGRLLIVERAHAGWKQAHIAAAMGVSRRCVKRWLDRYAEEGEAGLHDRSSRPHRIANRTPDAHDRRSDRGAGEGAARAGRGGGTHRGPGQDGVADPRPRRPAAPDRAGPDDRGADPRVKDHSGPLRTRTTR